MVTLTKRDVKEKVQQIVGLKRPDNKI